MFIPDFFEVTLNFCYIFIDVLKLINCTCTKSASLLKYELKHFFCESEVFGCLFADTGPNHLQMF